MWTPEQKAAIDIRDRNILVSAAAGSGKTAVLVERVIGRICDPEYLVDIDRLLIVTFTNAAALEMKERIGDGITKRLEQEPNNNHLQRQLHLLQRSSISTIHSFCLKVIRNYFHQIEIDPAFRIGNEAELKLIKGETIEAVFEALFESGREDFLRLVDSYTTPKSTTQLEEVILKLYTFSQSTTWPKAWLEASVAYLAKAYTTIDETKWAPIIYGDIMTKLDGAIMAGENALVLCRLSNGPGHYEPMLESDLEQLRACRGKVKVRDEAKVRDENENKDQQDGQKGNERGLLEVIQEISHIKFQALSRKRQECDPGLKDEVQDLRNNGVKKLIEGIQKDYILGSEAEILHNINSMSQVMVTLIEVVQLFSEKFQEAKVAKSLVDYNDLEHYCLDILLDPESTDHQIIPSIVAKELQEFYEEIYIDEYQDSNIVQETMLSVISRDDKNRFMVGDIKQSIYRFRLANPLLFVDKHDSYDPYNDLEAARDKVYIDLVKNFRNRGNVLDGINFIFDQVMSRKVGEVTYDETVALYTGATYPEPEEGIEVGGPIELHIIENSKDETRCYGAKKTEQDGINADRSEQDATQDHGYMEELTKREAETMLVAQMVRNMLDGKKSPTHVYDRKADGYRKIEPKDIVILLRTTMNVASSYVEALLSLGVGAFADVATGYFETIEIQTVLALLSIIDNPRQDIPLLTVLRSPIVGLSLDELAMIRQSQKFGCYYEALEGYIAQEEILDTEESQETPGMLATEESQETPGMLETEESQEVQVTQDFKNTQLLRKLQDFKTQFSKYRRWAIDLPMDELISKLFNHTGYYQYIGMLPTGLQKQANLRILKKHAAEFEGSSFTGLFNFMNYIDRVQKTSGDFAEAKTVGENENLVRIMSIHKSKGLEFPVVFLCTTDKKFNTQDLIEPVLLHHEYGIGAKYIDVEDRVVYNTFPRIAISQQIKAENISEEMRVLYVALTRAKEKLILTGSVDNFDKTLNAWGQSLNRKTKAVGTYTAMKANCYLDWIGTAFMSHPDAQALRETLQKVEEGYVCNNETSRWLFKRWDKSAISAPGKTQKEQLDIRKEELTNWDTTKTYSPYKDEINERLNWQYPFKQATKLPVKMTVSEIKQRWNTQDEEAQVMGFGSASEQPTNRPSFMGEQQKYTPAERGTMIHSVLQHLDLGKAHNPEQIKSQLRHMILQGKVQEAIVDLVNIQRLIDFASHPITQRLKNAKKVYKEQQFVLLMDAQEVMSSFQAEDYKEEIMVQGVIDCFFEEADGYVLVDYKTDYVPQGNSRGQAIEQIKKNYAKQIEIYARAIEDITEQRVKERYLYLYSADEWVAL